MSPAFSTRYFNAAPYADADTARLGSPAAEPMEDEHALGCECANPNLQIDQWPQDAAALFA